MTTFSLPFPNFNSISNINKDFVKPTASDASLNNSSAFPKLKVPNIRKSHTSHGSTFKKLTYVQQLEAQLSERLKDCFTNDQIFEAHQKTLENLIQHYSAQIGPFMKVKEQYDTIIEHLRTLIITNQRKTRSIRKSIYELRATLTNSADKYEKKKQKYANLINTIHDNISYLSQENASFQSQSLDLARENANSRILIDEQYSRINDILNSYKDTQQTLESYKAQKQYFKKQLDDVLEEYELLSQQLESTFSNYVERSKQEIQVKKNIEEMRNKLEQIQVFFASKAETLEKCEIEEENLKEELDSIKKKIDECTSKADQLNHIIFSLVQTKVPLYVIRQYPDPVKQLALYLSYENGYSSGIDPELFPDLV